MKSAQSIDWHIRNIKRVLVVNVLLGITIPTASAAETELLCEYKLMGAFDVTTIFTFDTTTNKASIQIGAGNDAETAEGTLQSSDEFYDLKVPHPNGESGDVTFQLQRRTGKMSLTMGPITSTGTCKKFEGNLF